MSHVELKLVRPTTNSERPASDNSRLRERRTQARPNVEVRSIDNHRMALLKSLVDCIFDRTTVTKLILR